MIPATLCLSLSIGAILWPTVVQPKTGTNWGLKLSIIFFFLSLFGTSFAQNFGVFLLGTIVTGLTFSWFMPSSGIALNRWFVKYRIVTNQSMEIGLRFPVFYFYRTS